LPGSCHYGVRFRGVVTGAAMAVAVATVAATRVAAGQNAWCDEQRPVAMPEAAAERRRRIDPAARFEVSHA